MVGWCSMGTFNDPWFREGQWFRTWHGTPVKIAALAIRVFVVANAESMPASSNVNMRQSTQLYTQLASFDSFRCVPRWGILPNNRRNFRSETSDNTDSWKAEVRRVRTERVRRKKMQMREKVGKSRNTVFFQWFGAPEGRKVGSLKRRVRSQLARWEMKNCTPLWREAHFQVKMYKAHHGRTTFGSWDVERVHAVVARSTFRSQKCKRLRFLSLFWR